MSNKIEVCDKDPHFHKVAVHHSGMCHTVYIRKDDDNLGIARKLRVLARFVEDKE